MRAASLLGVLLLARVCVLAGREIPVSVWTPIAYVWQDFLVALVYGALDSLFKRDWAGWTLYAVVVFYTAVSVPITLVLSSPLTWTMLRAARGPLLDSVRHHLSSANILFVGLIILAGAVLPWICTRVKVRVGDASLVSMVAVIAAGPFAVSQVETLGLHRSALGALFPRSFLNKTLRPDARDWRRSPFEDGDREDLTRLRAAAEGRSVILVILESTAARYLKPYGAPEDPMPNLTKLSERSILFENAYAVYPESIKGLLSTLCSRYPAVDTTAESYAGNDWASLADVLKRSGYHTGLFHSGRFMYLGMESVISGRGFDSLEDAGSIGGNVNSSFGVDEPSTVKRILSWIDSLPPGDPFFVTYLPVAGHHPYWAPEAGPFAGESDLRSYYNALYYGDKALGELFQGLQARRLEEKSLWVLIGDHGEAFGQHPGNYGHTLFIYEENIRVPCVIAAPGLVGEQIRVRRAASAIDAAPTILDLLGFSPPLQFQGSSLLEPRARMALFFTDYSLGWLGLRDACWKYVHEMDSGRSKLFNLCADPGETKDLSAGESPRTGFYRETLEHWIASQSVSRSASH